MRDEKKKKRLKLILIIIGLIALILAGLYGGIEVVNRAKITNFEVKINNITCTDHDQIAQHLKSLDLKYFSFKQDELARNLRKKFFCIGKIETRVSYPDKLSVEAWGREAVFAVREVNTYMEVNPVIDLPDLMGDASESTRQAAAVKTLSRVLSDLKPSSGSGILLSDRDGIIFEQISGEAPLPLLSILGYKLKIGRQIPNGIVEKAAIVYNKLREIDAPTDNIIVMGDRLVINSKPRIIFSLKKRLDYQTASLQLILAQSKINSDPDKTGSNNIESIDLRFDKPVVVYGKK